MQKLKLDYTKHYTAQDLQAAIGFAKERAFKCSMPFRVAAAATAADRAAALDAWQRVAELAAWLEIHADDDESRDAARSARELAEQERQRLASMPMSDDQAVSDRMRRDAIAAGADRHFIDLPASMRSAISGRYVPQSQDLNDDPTDRLEADILDMQPRLITCERRKDAK